MANQIIQIQMEVLPDISSLSDDDRELLKHARAETASAYAPYSHFRVAAMARLDTGDIVPGTNQENASYPVGICAERALLGTVANLYPGKYIDTIAISYQAENGDSQVPITPCGMCRQALKEFEDRMSHPIRLILSGQEGPVWILSSASDLLPLSFGKKNLHY